MSRYLYLFAFLKFELKWMFCFFEFLLEGNFSLDKRQHHLPQCQITDNHTCRQRRLTDSAPPYEPSTPPC